MREPGGFVVASEVEVQQAPQDTSAAGTGRAIAHSRVNEQACLHALVCVGIKEMRWVQWCAECNSSTCRQ